MEACCALEVQAGASFDDLTVQVNRGRITALRWVLWAALQAQHADRVITADHAGAVLDAAGGPRIMRGILGEFLRLNADDDPPKKEPGAKPVPPDTRPGSLWRRLYLDARGLGIHGEAYWQLSLCELWLELAAGRQQATADRDRVLTQAWYISAAVWSGFAGKLPALQQWLGTKQRDQTPGDQIAMLQHLSEFYGIPLRVTKAGAPTSDTKGTHPSGQ